MSVTRLEGLVTVDAIPKMVATLRIGLVQVVVHPLVPFLSRYFFKRLEIDPDQKEQEMDG